ncbi:MAG: DUF3034 family protein [Betaproteobacteria bacterium]|nr:DUF3034 family protein [Betaproteobacteria bacterium]
MRVFASLFLLLLCTPVRAWDIPEPGSRLAATGGVSQLEGSGGGGLTPWALITGYGDRDEIGVTAFYTRTDPSDFTLRAAGVALGIHDRLELSFARQRLGLGTTVPGQTISQDIVGLKVRVTGDAVFDQDRWWPQIAIGAQFKHNGDMNVPRALGAKHASGTDVYVAATKVWLGACFGRNLLANLTFRATKANQLGLLGFGGDRRDSYRVVPEASIGVFLTEHVVVGAEYRRKPDNLGAFPEDSYADAFVAWFIGKRLSVTVAWAALGQIADKPDQQALYLSGQLAF